jgi:hypothetical protein
MVKDVDNYGFKLIIIVIYGLTTSRFQVVELWLKNVDKYYCITVSGSTQDDLVMCSCCFERLQGDMYCIYRSMHIYIICIYKYVYTHMKTS